jgi:long-chain fatty acid transport protein
MTTPYARTRIAIAIAGVSLGLAGSEVFAAAFSLQDSSNSALGNAYAGGAAAAEDASTIWSNAAGMSRIGTSQLVAGVAFVQPSIKFSNSGSIAALNQPLGGDGGDAGSLGVLPNLYLVVPINREWTFGLGVTAPFGLKTEYDGGWIGRYQGLKSEVKTINVNPALSWKVTDYLAIGAGASYQQIKATLTQSVNYSAGMAQAAQTAAAGGLITPAQAGAIVAQTGGLDSFASLTGDDSSWGWNVGVLIDLNKDNRIGASWRSDIKYNVSGNVSFTNPTLPTLVPAALNPIGALLASNVNQNPLLANGGVTSNIKLPGIANISWFGHVSDQWDVMADVQWTHWSTLQDLTFVRTTGDVLESIPEHYKDVWRYSLGASYQYDPAWKFRIGVAFDQSPVQQQYLDVRLPDNDRTWLAAGVQYAMKDPNLKFDLGIAYEWVKNSSIAQISTNPLSVAQYGYVSGSYKNNVPQIGGQLTWSF